MTGLEFNEKMARFTEIMEEACKIMKEVKQYAFGIKSIEEDITEVDKFNYGIERLEMPKNMEARFLKACYREEIDTIGSLVVYGKHKFGRLRDVGRKTLLSIEDALEEQYNIKWH